MLQDLFANHSPFLGGVFAIGFGLVVAVVAIWSLIWKGLALWKSARQGSKVWFVVLLLVNTLGILDILYIYVFSRKDRVKKMMEPAQPVVASIEDEKDATVV
jgi:hypothetical protein